MKFRMGVVLLCLSAMVYSAEPPVFVTGVRPLGMGGAFTAVSDDYSLLQYNPAGLAKLKNFQLNILHLEVETNQKTIDFIKWFIDNSSRLTSGDLTTWTSNDINMLSNAGVRVYVATNISAVGINTPIGNLGVGVFGIANTDVAIEYDILNINAKMSSNIDIVVPVSYGTLLQLEGLNNFFDSYLGRGRLGVGATAKFIQRMQLVETRSAFDLSNINPTELLKKLTTPSTGIGFDLGVNYYLDSLASTFSLVVQDVYTSVGGRLIPGSINFGYAFYPDLLKGLADLTVAVDVRGLNNNLTILNKLHIGAEASFLGFFNVRVGFYQGWTGFGLGIGRIIEYANYGVEAGMYPGQIEDRQHRISLGLSF